MEYTKRESHEDSFYTIDELQVLGTCDKQEDSLCVVRKGMFTLLAVCDGMGGLERGELASKAAAETVRKCAEEWTNDTDPVKFLKNTVERANLAVEQVTDENGRLLTAGSTICIALIKGIQLYVANVGDSRVCLINKSGLVRLTTDMNYAEKLKRMLERGEISKEGYKEEIRQGKALTSYLGMGELDEVYVSDTPVKVDQGSVVLLESDGLYKLLSDTMIQEIVALNSRNTTLAGENLIEKAAASVAETSSKYQDNTSIILFRVK